MYTNTHKREVISNILNFICCESMRLSIRLDLLLTDTHKATIGEIYRLKKHTIVTSVHVNVPHTRHGKLLWFSLSVNINVVVVPFALRNTFHI